MREEDIQEPAGPTRLCEAADQIRRGSRMLVREVKVLHPEAVGLDSEMLLSQVEQVAGSIEEGDLEGAGRELERCLAPLLAGPGYPRRRRRRWLAAAVLLGVLVGTAAFLVTVV